MDDADEPRLLPAVLVLMMNGALGAMLAIQAAAVGSPIAAPVALITLATIGACRALDVDRPWSLRLAAIVAPLGASVWIAAPIVGDVTGDETIIVVCVAMALVSVWTRSYLLRLAAGPEWMRSSPAPGLTEAEGWIEDLPPQRELAAAAGGR